MQEAMQLMDELQQMDELERQLRGVRAWTTSRRSTASWSSGCSARRRPRTSSS